MNGTSDIALDSLAGAGRKTAATQAQNLEPLTFTLEYASGAPVYRQIVQQVECGIKQGSLTPGDRLPTIRQLAVTLKVNPNTIGKAYREMELRGLVVTQVGSGTYIASTEEQTAESEEERLVRVSVEEFVEKMTDLGVERDRLCRMIEAEYRNKAGKHGIKRNKNT